MLNLLTIDLEDYFQVHAFSSVIRYENWDKFECRIERNTDRLLEILNSVSSPQSSQAHSTTATSINSSAISNQQSTVNNPIRATFFVLGWIAERYPGLVRRIQKEGHEIACHGYAHQLVYTQSRDQFRQDVRRAKSILEDITGSEVVGYRAPSYSITNKSKWAFDVLVEEGFKYDSSVFPIRHDIYGMPKAPRFPFVVSLNGNDNVEFSGLKFELLTASPQHPDTTGSLSLLRLLSSLGSSNQNNPNDPSNPINPSNSITQVTQATQATQVTASPQRYLLEFPISTAKLLGQNVPLSGGGYFRLLPYSIVKRGLTGINGREDQPFIFYLHPWEIDPEQPRIRGLSSRSKFRHYVNLNKTEDRFRRLLRDFKFASVKDAMKQVH